MAEKLNSRKFWAFVIVVVSHLVNGFFGNPIDESTMAEVTKMALGYIVGQGVVDAAKEFPALSAFGGDLGVKLAKEAAERKAAKEAEAAADEEE